MRQLLRTGAIGLCTLILTGCGGPGGRLAKLTPAELLALLPTGRPLLDCREACLSEWKAVQPKAQQLEADGAWRDLAVLVLQTGYQDDLSLYYLGRAAEGLGYDAAAASYYRQSMQLSGTTISCAYLSKLCGGVLLPATTAQRLTVTMGRLSPAVPRRPRAVAPKAPAPAESAPQPTSAPLPAQPPGTTAGEPSLPPPSPSAQPPSAATPAPPPPSPAPTLEYIEPPPARR
jgi:hypothetical protein